MLGMLLAEFEVLLSVPPLSLPLPLTVADVTVEDGVWRKVKAPAAVVKPVALGTLAR